MYFVFLLSIFGHELGHALAVWLGKAKVKRIQVGIGPRLFRVGVFQLRLVPLGGFVESEGISSRFHGVVVAIAGVLAQAVVGGFVLLSGIAKLDPVFWGWFLVVAVLSFLMLFPIGNSDGAVAVRWAFSKNQPSNT